MYKIIFCIFIFLTLSHCSIDNKSGFWENKNVINKEGDISEINFSKDLSYDDFKKKIILYGKKGEFPNLME